MNKLSKILIGVISVLVIVSWYFHIKQSNRIQNFITAWAEISNMFYNAKDANLCLLWVISETVSYARCETYLDKTISDYKTLNEFLGVDNSKYFPDN